MFYISVSWVVNLTKQFYNFSFPILGLYTHINVKLFALGVGPTL